MKAVTTGAPARATKERRITHATTTHDRSSASPSSVSSPNTLLPSLLPLSPPGCQPTLICPHRPQQHHRHSREQQRVGQRIAVFAGLHGGVEGQRERLRAAGSGAGNHEGGAELPKRPRKS